MWTAHQPPSRVTSMSKLGIGPCSEVDLFFKLKGTRAATRRFKVTIPGSRNVAKDVFRSRAVDPNGRLRAGEGRRVRAIRSTRGGGGPSRSRSRPRRGAAIDRGGLIASPPWPGAPPRSGLRPDGLDGADHRGVEGHGQWYRGRGGSRVHTLSPAPLNHCPIHDMLTV